jgi:Fe-S-cluster containining protein
MNEETNEDLVARLAAMPNRPPPGSPCNQCGKCCTNPSFMGTLSADAADVRRWKREKRYDILRFVAKPIFPGCDADLWIDERTGIERNRCPFVRKNPNSLKHRCTIYDTRPGVCRRYKAWEPGSICEEI